jgi:hypothetical protein
VQDAGVLRSEGLQALGHRPHRRDDLFLGHRRHFTQALDFFTANTKTSRLQGGVVECRDYGEDHRFGREKIVDCITVEVSRKL